MTVANNLVRMHINWYFFWNWAYDPVSRIIQAAEKLNPKVKKKCNLWLKQKLF